MRLFAALVPPPEVVAHADRALAPVRSRHPELCWVPAHRWHLTLAFFGEVADGDVDGVAGMVGGRVRGNGPVRLRLRGAGHFAGRALWLGVAGDVDGLRSLAGAVALDDDADDRPYLPHLTVARLPAGQDASAATAELADHDGPSWEVDRVHLVRSRLGASPAYDGVLSWPLALRS